MALTITLTPGKVWVTGETWSADKANSAANPIINLAGSIGSIGIADGSVTTPKLNDGVLTADSTGRAKMANGFIVPSKLDASVYSGMLLQMVIATSAAMTDITALIPNDDTLPQNTEGTQLLTATITPKLSSSNLLIEALVEGAQSAQMSIILALFRDATASAIAAALTSIAVNGFSGQIALRWVAAAGSTAATTFNLRVGLASAGHFYVNGAAAARVLGGSRVASLTIKEIAV